MRFSYEENFFDGYCIGYCNNRNNIGLRSRCHDRELHKRGRWTINIGGYECYERDGQYWTIDDGDECLVIDVGDCDDYEVCSPVSLNDDIPFPPNWTNSRVLYSPHNTVREDTADLSQGDYCSPLFRVFPVAGDNGFNLKFMLNCSFNPSKKLNITFYTYSSSGQSWSDYTKTITFGSGGQHVLLVGSAIKTTGAIAMRFNKAQSDNVSTFNYSFQVQNLAGILWGDQYVNTH